MTRLYNDPSQFADEAIDGFVTAHRDVRSDELRRGVGLEPAR